MSSTTRARNVSVCCTAHQPVLHLPPLVAAPWRRAARVTHLERVRRRVAAHDVEAPVGVRSAVRFARAVQVGARACRRVGQGPDLRPDPPPLPTPACRRRRGTRQRPRLRCRGRGR